LDKNHNNSFKLYNLKIKMAESDNLDKLVIGFEDKPNRISPGDLTKFVPYGNGVYGYQRKFFNPIINDPPQEASGGAVYFRNRIKQEDFEGFLRMMMDGHENLKNYAIFIKESSEPLVQRYFKQKRIVSKFALRHMFRVINENEYKKFKEQELTIREALWSFIESERNRFKG